MNSGYLLYIDIISEITNLIFCITYTIFHRFYKILLQVSLNIEPVEYLKNGIYFITKYILRFIWNYMHVFNLIPLYSVLDYKLCPIIGLKIGCSLMDFDIIFPTQSLEFTKSLKFRSISRKKKQPKKIWNFSPKKM